MQFRPLNITSRKYTTPNTNKKVVEPITNSKYKSGEKVFYHEGHPRQLGITFECVVLKVLPDKMYLVEAISGKQQYTAPQYLLKRSSEKGIYGKNCNRTDCQQHPATFKHKHIDAYYCLECVMKIGYEFFES